MFFQIRSEELLDEFFLFYSTFDASKNELSPWTGGFQAKTCEKSTFSIIDPFEHDHNLSSNLSETNWLKFRDECRLARTILNEAGRKRLHKSWGLSLILTRKSLPLKDFQSDSFGQVNSIQKIELKISTKTQEKLNEEIYQVFEQILLFDPVDSSSIRKKRSASPMEEENQINPTALAEKFDETLSTKRRRIDDDGLSSTTNVDQERDFSNKNERFYRVDHRTWQDRRRLRRNIDHQNSDVPIVEREKLISLQLKQEQENMLKTAMFFSVETNVFVSNNENKLRIFLRSFNTENQQSFIDLVHFLNVFLPKMISA